MARPTVSSSRDGGAGNSRTVWAEFGLVRWMPLMELHCRRRRNELPKATSIMSVLKPENL